MNLLAITSTTYLSANPADWSAIFVHRQFMALQRLGWDIRVINPQPVLYRELHGKGQDYPPRSSRDGITVWRPRYLWLPRLIPSQQPAAEPFLNHAVQRVLPQVITGWQPDLVVCDWIVPGGVAAAAVARQLNVPLILRTRGQDTRVVLKTVQRDAAQKRHYNRLGAQAHWVTCQGTGLKEELLAAGLFSPERLLAVTNGLDTDRFHPPTPAEKHAARAEFGLPADGQVWSFVARWESPKGSHELTTALLDVLTRFPEVTFVAAGPIKDTASRDRLAALGERVRFLGPVNPGHVSQLLQASDLFLLPSHHEGLPNAMLEAMATGLPVIVTGVGGIPDIVTDSVNGVIVPARDSKALGEALARFATHPCDFAPFGTAARQTIFDRSLDMPTVAEATHELFTSAVEQPRETPPAVTDAPRPEDAAAQPKYKICHMTSVHPPFDNRIFEKQCKTIRAAGYEIVLVAPHDRDEVVDGVRIRAVPRPSGRLRRATQTAFNVFRAALDEDADLYQIHDPELLPFAQLLRLRGKPVVFDIHENIPASMLEKPWVPSLLRKPLSMTYQVVERVLTFRIPVLLAETSYERVYAWVKERTLVLNLPDLQPLFEIDVKPYETPTVGYIGRVVGVRGSTITLDVLRELKQRGYQVNYECIGTINTDAYRAELEATAARYDLHGVTLYGFMRPREGWRIIGRCQAGLALMQPAPNKMESYPTKIFEYMALGIPVITSNFPLYMEVIESARCGFCVDPTDVNAIADAIQFLLDHPEEARAMGEQGRIAVKEKYNWDTEAAKLLGLYTRLLSRRN